MALSGCQEDAPIPPSVRQLTGQPVMVTSGSLMDAPAVYIKEELLGDEDRFIHDATPEASTAHHEDRTSTTRARAADGEPFNTQCFQKPYLDRPQFHRLKCGHDVATTTVETCAAERDFSVLGFSGHKSTNSNKGRRKPSPPKRGPLFREVNKPDAGSDPDCGEEDKHDGAQDECSETYCVCESSDLRLMVECNDCDKPFHPSCIGKGSQPQTQYGLPNRDEFCVFGRLTYMIIVVNLNETYGGILNDCLELADVNSRYADRSFVGKGVKPRKRALAVSCLSKDTCQAKISHVC